MLEKQIKDSITIKKTFLLPEFRNTLIEIISILEKAVWDNKTIYFAGNGGSMADACHIAAELTGRMYKDRMPLKAEALTTNLSELTCISNDYSYSDIFSRLLVTKANPGDVLILLSTSGRSKNIIKAAKIAKSFDITVVGFTGIHKNMNKHCDVTLNVPSSDTARIQEAYMFILHCICEHLEKLERE